MIKNLATVITNLLSALPWIGKDFVEFLWGGLYTDEPYNSDIVLKILLIAGTFLCLKLVYFRIIDFGVKKTSIKEISAEVDLTSQRLNAENLIPYLVGLFEGDGWFSVSKKGVYVIYEVGIELHERDIQLLYKIKTWLGVGVVGIRKDREICYFRVRNKEHLKKNVLPIFQKYPILSVKQYDYLRLESELIAGTIYSKDLKEYKRPAEESNTISSILSTSYFYSWLVGFIEAEGCFSTYTAKNGSEVASFDISQTHANNLITAIGIHFYHTGKPFLDKTNSSKLKISSVRGVENVIKFIQGAPMQLQGHKKLSYLLWIKKLRKIDRYSSRINLPV